MNERRLYANSAASYQLPVDADRPCPAGRPRTFLARSPA